MSTTPVVSKKKTKPSATTSSAIAAAGPESEPNNEVDQEALDRAWNRYQQKLYQIGKPIVRLMIPISTTLVLICILLSVVCSSEDCHHGVEILPFKEQSEQSFETNTKNALLNVLALVGLIVVLTFVMFLIIYFRLHYLILAHVFLVLCMVLTCLTLTFLYIVCTVYEISLDWITVLFGIWNLTITGLLSFFILRSPLILRQFYLIYLSCLLSSLFIVMLPPITTWILLGALVIWDLVAVLTPWGPLRLIIELIERRRKQNKGKDQFQLPEVMIYSTIVYIMAENNEKNNDNKDKDGQSKMSEEGSPPSESQDQGSISNSSSSSPREIRPKLGLGDFIFYSILVGKTSIANQLITTVFASVAILFGLISTLFLLIIYRRALPALPISLMLALPVVMVMSFFGENFNNNLALRQVFI